MKDISTVNWHPTTEKLVQILCQKTQNNNPLFFRVLAAYYFTKIASMMRVNIQTHDRGKIPVNLYAIALAVSGSGKGHSTNIIEEQVIHKFKDRYTEETFVAASESNLAGLASKRAAKKGVDDDEEFQRVTAEFERLGALAFSFDSGTTAAVKQMRHKLLMANAGSMNLEIDEIGSNLLGNVDVLNTFLELFDVGKVKQKLTKNTAENQRSEEIDGRTPTNMLLFGTPPKLLDGGKTEEQFYSFLETGYSRRCFFAYSKGVTKEYSLTPEQVYQMLTDTTSDQFIIDLSDQLYELADLTNFYKTLTLTKDVTLIYLEYKIRCEQLANELPEHEEIRKAELSHRYFKALKLAGVYAFIDGWHEITEDHLYAAIKLAEESGNAFQSLLTRDRNYVKLAKYLANVGREVTHVDLVEDLPFYKGSSAQKAELMALATAYGYKKGIIIKRSYTDGIEFLRGETIQETNLDKMVLSYSDDIATGYSNEIVPFDQLHMLTQQPAMHWVNHHLAEGHRKEDNAIQGFNLLVLDVDNTTSLHTVKLLLKDFTYHIHTTKRHTDSENRFRVILPLSHTLKLDASEYREFMQNIYEWLPFDVDTQTGQRARKWLTHDGEYHYNEGQLVDALQFIPKTSKNDERKKIITDLQSLSNMERWFIANTGAGNRSNQLIKYALMLVDSGRSIDEVRNNVLALNNKLQDKLDESEVVSTILVTAAKAIQKREST